MPASRHWRAGLSVIAVMAVAVAIILAGFPTSFGGSGPNELILTVTNASQFNRNGKIAVKVEGRIVNTSSRPVPVEVIDIVLAQDQGHQFYRWRYKPALRQLKPGASLRFATADGNVPRPASHVEIGVGTMTAARPL